MSTLTENRTTASAPRGTTTHDVTFPRVVHAEWIKFRTLRSTAWVLGLTVLVMAGLSALMGWAATLEGGGEVTGSAATLVTFGYTMAQLAVAVLGVLTVTGEYSTGMIRSTFAAVPRRLPALGAKVLVVAAVVAVVSVVGIALAHLVSLPFQSRAGLSLDLSDGETLRILLGTPLYLATIAVFSLAIGAIVRNSAGALAIVLGLLLVVENVFSAIPLAFFQNVSPFLPSTAGSKLLTDAEMAEAIAQFTTGPQLGPWEGYGVLVGWVVVLLAVAAVLLRRRDA
ncbi:ABC transporter permease [Actinotalea sp. K2]|uniref:ABC transporter permease n=1 Tax=Actinotalea sp. K2 TaxID=2939438 RepID=UPI002017C561|nr:ABC transporter permease [Actinotalea sp. K2]MCL3861322.1 ABC transporter permease [Actinotalea sp. K2]